ncbi:hypothetical protein D9M68_814430 [compost metagenome]
MVVYMDPAIRCEQRPTLVGIGREELGDLALPVTILVLPNEGRTRAREVVDQTHEFEHIALTLLDLPL